MVDRMSSLMHTDKMHLPHIVDIEHLIKKVVHDTEHVSHRLLEAGFGRIILDVALLITNPHCSEGLLKLENDMKYFIEHYHHPAHSHEFHTQFCNKFDLYEHVHDMTRYGATEFNI